ncbi:RNA polymerase sigma-70 factor (ECF subfamily) [Methylosinus sp. sav-2]|uniref:RNA polymerase sigma factor n=1 Tax=Methylosinus sp. sav-2 TaxID=2485168 RepID=UPI00047C5E6A|nr:RNA polymerase sigma factor [Methylosinus sp. sav-2]TDX62104.1 RNA polymerase sigma-70 factor (ECF subfamily) [Methylosinus sp. sav-2]
MARQRSDTLREALTRHSRDLLRFLTRRVGADVAPDLAQEAMLRALHYSEREEVREISSLLHSIAANLARDHVRRAILESRFLVRGLEVDDLIVGGLSPGARLEAEQAIKRFAEALEALPPRCRQVFVMRRFEDLHQEEIARRLGISRNMVEKHLRAAFRHLRGALD